MTGFRNTTRAVFRAAVTVGVMSGAVMLTVRAGPGAKEEALDPSLGPTLGAQPGILRVQLWQAAVVPTPATLEAALRGRADKGADWSVTVEAAAAEDLQAVDARLRDAAGRSPVVATYQFLCGLEAPS